VRQIHRGIGITGGLLVQVLVPEVGHQVSNELANELPKRHAEINAKFRKSVKLLPGPRGLLRYLKEIGILYDRCERATREGQPAALAMEIAAEVPINTRGQAKRAKADADIFSGRGGCTRYTCRKYSDGWESSWIEIAINGHTQGTKRDRSSANCGRPAHTLGDFSGRLHSPGAGQLRDVTIILRGPLRARARC
jgi:hypothetical protein